MGLAAATGFRVFTWALVRMPLFLLLLLPFCCGCSRDVQQLLQQRDAELADVRGQLAQAQADLEQDEAIFSDKMGEMAALRVALGEMQQQVGG